VGAIIATIVAIAYAYRLAYARRVGRESVET
jgi:hypothetical protein